MAPASYGMVPYRIYTADWSTTVFSFERLIDSRIYICIVNSHSLTR